MSASTAHEPLSGIRVLDFSTLLPGPMATLFLAEAGAEVLKIERPPEGDPMRRFEPLVGGTSALYSILNRGKRAVSANLKDRRVRDHVLELMSQADVVVEQFRPGVMDRLGLGYEVARARNPELVYCSISGWGPSGLASTRAGHDLNFQAESGLLGSVLGSDASQHLPPALVGDLAGGMYPAVVNILMALLRRNTTGSGCRIEVGMLPSLRLFAYASIATHEVTGQWPSPNSTQETGASARYNVYRTSDDRYIAVAALEDRFWNRFCDLVGLPEAVRISSGLDPTVIDTVAAAIGEHSAEHWAPLTMDPEACCSLVSTFAESARVWPLPDDRWVALAERELSAVPIPLMPSLLTSEQHAAAPSLETSLESLAFS